MTWKNVAVVFLVSWLACCGVEGAADAIGFTEADSGRTIGISVGQELVITLESNASTGFSWSFLCTPADALGSIGEPEYIVNNPVMLGSGGMLRFRLTALRTGEATLRFEYRRSWENDVPPAKTVTYFLVVG